jgi:subtilisin family serine protease
VKRRSFVLIVALATLLATAAAPAIAQEADVADVQLGTELPVERSEFDSYIVLMRSDPLVVTEGRENLRTNRARNRGQRMKAEHDRVLRETGVGVENKVADYLYVLNGFVAHVTHAEAQRLQAHKDVALVLPDELYQPTTDASSDFLGLSGPGGAHRTANLTGRGVVVGIIDTGIWPEHPSFSPAGMRPPRIPPLVDITVGGPTGPYHIPACSFGNTAHNPDDAPFNCNRKLVGARQVLPSYRQLIGAEDFEFDSARDDDGHGSHTAGTAAGNRNVAASIFGIPLGNVTGIAPDAHIIAYKGLGALGGFGSDLALAIDIAGMDRVSQIK